MGHSTRRLMMGAAGAGEKTYLDDVFSTYLYRGNGSGSGNTVTRVITNNIDLTDGGLVWIKQRDTVGPNSPYSHQWFDTERGTGKYLLSNTNAAQGDNWATLSAFNNNGFTLRYEDVVNRNESEFS